MSRPLLAVACTLVGGALTAQTTLFVAPAATGTGSAWSSAASLPYALDHARAGDVLWLAAGTYATSATANRDATFAIPSGVSVLGGFAGNEASAAQRDPQRHVTILCGEIGSPDTEDNAFTVVTLTDASPQTLLDGVTIVGGHASGSGPVADPRRAGGGVLVRVSAPGKASAPVFTECTFEANYARDGGAVYVDGTAGRATPAFVGCAFRQNEADLDGGAVYSDGRRFGEASPSFVDCTFTRNEANYGAALFNQATKGTASPRLTSCRFVDNRAYVRGTTLYNVDHQGTSRAILVECTFDDNSSAGTTPVDDLARGL